MKISPSRHGGVVALALALAGPSVAGAQRLSFRHVTLELPGPPAKVIPADVNRDGRNDLVLVLTYTEVGRITEDRIEEMVQLTTVIPSVFDRRELRVYLAQEDGTYAPEGAPLELPTSVLGLEPGPPGLTLVAVTDAGVSRVVYGSDGTAPALRLEPLIDDRPALAGTDSFFATLTTVHELNGDGIPDLLLPAVDGLAVYLGTGSGLATEPADRIAIETPERLVEGRIVRRQPVPEVVEVDADGIPDLVFSFLDDSPAPLHVLLGSPRGRFRPLRSEAEDCHDRLSDLRIAGVGAGADPWPHDLVALEDIDGDGRAEAVFAEELARDGGFRADMKDAKKPIRSYRFHRLTDDARIAPEPYFEMKVVGHTPEFDEDAEVIPFVPRMFADLDGDGRKDLVTLTLDFSIFQALKILMTKRITIGLDFHVYAQDGDGRFEEVPGLDLSEKLKLDLNRLEIRRLAQFAGDFDGDGRYDFAHFGRGRQLTLHAGTPGCRYPKKPDLALTLAEEPASIDLVKVEDMDGDGRSDLRIVRPLPQADPDASAPVMLDLYLSGGGS